MRESLTGDPRKCEQRSKDYEIEKNKTIATTTKNKSMGPKGHDPLGKCGGMSKAALASTAFPSHFWEP